MTGQSLLLFGASDTLCDQAADGFRPRPDALTGAPLVQGFDFLGADDQLNSHVLFLHVGFMPERGDGRNISDDTNLHKPLDLRNSKVCNFRNEHGDNPMTFQLDTSGVVGPMPGWAKPVPTSNRNIYWSDLSPFTQGYIEALLVSFGHYCVENNGDLFVSFSDLAPETLARIIADCEVWFGEWVQHPNNAAVRKDDQTEGGRFWAYRQASEMTQFPPLTVHLGDDGKVRFA